jgi:energy-coupling factor transport system ATP-binding protein
MLRDYQRTTGATVIIVSHSMEDMARFCDDIVVLAHGRLVMQGRGPEVFARAEELAAVGLNIPEISRMCLMLRDRGIPVDDGIFTVEQAEACLLRLLNEKNGEGRA